MNAGQTLFAHRLLAQPTSKEADASQSLAHDASSSNYLL